MEGSRKPHTPPFQLFVVANVLFFALQSFTGMNIFGSSLDSHLHQQDWSSLAQTLLARHLEATHRSLEQYSPVFDRAVVLNAKSLVILMVMPFAVLLPLAFFRSRKPFMGHVVFSVHAYTFLLLLFSAAVLVARVDALFGGAGLRSPRLDNVLSIINFAACAAYLYVAMGPAYGGTGPTRAVKALALSMAVGAIVLGYRFALFLITLYGT
jgi:hypothetical protein